MSGSTDQQFADNRSTLACNLGSLMTISTLLIIVLVLVALGAVPAWPHSRSWGYGPSGIAGVLLIVLLLLASQGRI